MNVTPTILVLAAILLSASACSADDQQPNVSGIASNGSEERADALRAGFAHLPAAAKARTWWHWLNGNVSKAGITADLEALPNLSEHPSVTLLVVACGATGLRRVQFHRARVPCSGDMTSGGLVAKW